MASCIKINSEEKRRNLVALLNGDVEMVESLLRQNNGRPLPVFDAGWGDDYFNFNSYQFCYVLYDALLYSNDERDYLGRNIPEMLNLHKRLCGPSQRIHYLVDKYITDEARAKGEELMRKYDAYYPILRHKPESDVNILNNGSGTPSSL